MNTIRNYLESMFANMPNTAEVLRAKDELWQMMEDKYNELIGEGRTENEAVGEVISNFGNLSELSEALGLQDAMKEEAESGESSRIAVTVDEASAYLFSSGENAFLIAIGVMLCILSVVGPLVCSVTKIPSALGVLAMLAMVGIAIFLFVASSSRMKPWKYLEQQPCMLDYAAANYVEERKEEYHQTHSTRLVIGIILCAVSWVPAAIVDEATIPGLHAISDWASILLFVLVAVGVFLIVLTCNINGGFDTLLKCNTSQTVSGNYAKEAKKEYSSNIAETIMSVYWPTVTCIYLSYSFLTFSWGKSWLIWIFAGVFHSVLEKLLSKK